MVERYQKISKKEAAAQCADWVKRKYRRSMAKASKRPRLKLSRIISEDAKEIIAFYTLVALICAIVLAGIIASEKDGALSGQNRAYRMTAVNDIN